MKKLFYLLLIVCGAFAANAQITPPGKTEVQTVVKEVMYLINKHYVIPETGKKINTVLRQNLKAGKYENLGSYKSLAKVITKDLQALSNDGHLYLKKVSNNVVKPKKDSPKKRRNHHGGPTDEMFNRFRNANGKFFESKILTGNIGYLNLPVFPSMHLCKTEIETAMATLQNCDALIFDARNCPGGEGSSMAYLAGYLFSKKTALNHYFRSDKKRRTSYTKKVTGKVMPDTPVYILTGKHSFSAGEAFCFYLQQAGRAKTVGIQTRGGGRANRLFVINDQLMLSVSVMRSISAVTGKGFQGVGVKPDLPCLQETALNTAHLAALRNIIAKNPDKESKLKNVMNALEKK